MWPTLCPTFITLANNDFKKLVLFNSLSVKVLRTESFETCHVVLDEPKQVRYAHYSQKDRRKDVPVEYKETFREFPVESMTFS